MRPGDFQLNYQQEAHLREILLFVEHKLEQKYINGAREHGGNLWDYSSLQLVDMAIEEAVDQLAFLITLRDRMPDNVRNGR